MKNGGARRSITLCSTGSSGATAGANVRAATIASTTSVARAIPGRRTMARHRPDHAVLTKLDPGVDPAVEHVDHEVDRHEHRRDEQDDGLHDRVVPGRDCIDGQAAE